MDEGDYVQCQQGECALLCPNGMSFYRSSYDVAISCIACITYLSSSTRAPSKSGTNFAGLLSAVAEGPRATEQFAAVVAVFVAALAASARAQDISARFLEQLVARLEQVRTCSPLRTGASICCFIMHHITHAHHWVGCH